MIQTNHLTKTFDGAKALDEISIGITDGSIYGLVGTNGSGKSTLLRLISGVYRPDGGTIEINGERPFENTAVKDSVTLVPDELYFFSHSTMDDMAKFYANLKTGFDRDYYSFLCTKFPIDPKKRIATFSKGMKRQAALILALASRPRYLLLDEAFDGLDPVIRAAVRKILADQIYERGLTVIISSHNLRELEDLCDHIGLLHNGKIIFEREIDESKLGFCKVQVAFSTPPDPAVFDNLNVLQKQNTGSITTLIVRGNSRDTSAYFEQHGALLAESVPLTLEEVFIYEMEAAGYDYGNIIF